MAYFNRGVSTLEITTAQDAQGNRLAYIEVEPGEQVPEDVVIPESQLAFFKQIRSLKEE